MIVLIFTFFFTFFFFCSASCLITRFSHFSFFFFFYFAVVLLSYCLSSPFFFVFLLACVKQHTHTHTTQVLRRGKIWGLNVGELWHVTRKGWEEFSCGLASTNVTHMYASEGTNLTAQLKHQMMTSIRKNRRSDKRHFLKGKRLFSYDSLLKYFFFCGTVPFDTLLLLTIFGFIFFLFFFYFF